MAQQNYRLFGRKRGSNKTAKHWIGAKTDDEALEKALKFARDRAGFQLNRLVHIPRKGINIDIPLPATI